MLGQVLLGFDNTCVQTYPSNNTGSRESKSRDQIGESDRVPVLKNYHSKNCIAKYLMTSEATLEDPLHSYLHGQSFVNFKNFRVNLLQLSLPPTFLSV